MFESSDKLLLGLLTGIVFGFLLQKGRAAKYQIIMGQFFLKDWTVVKIMGSAVAVGAIGIYYMRSLGMIHLEIKPAAFAGVIVGAILFGIGLAILGLCPGTTVAACGEGRRDAWVGFTGMLFGAAAYVVLFPPLQGLVKALGDWGKVTVPQVTHTSPWLWVGGIAAAVFFGYAFLEHYRSTQHPRKTVG